MTNGKRHDRRAHSIEAVEVALLGAPFGALAYFFAFAIGWGGSSLAIVPPVAVATILGFISWRLASGAVAAILAASLLLGGGSAFAFAAGAAAALGYATRRRYDRRKLKRRS